ncbi:MAG: Gfo/Idh/MocA family oxidoreductase [Chloroflexota bacterium]
MPSKELVVGAISSHGHERGHVSVLHQLPEVEAIHVCAATDLVDVEELAAESSRVVGKYTEVSDLLARPDLDAVIVCARPDHAPAILEQVVTAGLPVLYDKPAATHSSHMRQVAEAAQQKGVTAGAMLQWRYHPMVQNLKRALAEDALGDVMTIEAKILNGLLMYRDTSTYLFDPKTAGHGILSWLGCHCLDLVLYLMQERVVEVMAMVGNLNPEKTAVEDTGFLLLKFESGRLGTFQAGYHLRGSKSTYDYYVGMRGTEGYAILPLAEPYEPPGRNAADVGGTYTLYSEARHWITGRRRQERFEIPDSPSYGGVMAEELFRDFFAAAQNGATAPAPIEDSVHLLEIIETAKESSATGRAIAIV